MRLDDAGEVDACHLAAVGIYGVLSYWVSQQTRDIGIRMVLGAQAADIYKLIIFQALSAVLIGLGLSILAGALPHTLGLVPLLFISERAGAIVIGATHFRRLK